MNRRFTKKRNIASDLGTEDGQKVLISLKEWNWKLEQTISHLQARINAVENRLSIQQPLSSSGTSPPQRIEVEMNQGGIYQQVVAMIDQYEHTINTLDHAYQRLQQQVDLVEQKQKSSSIIMHVKGKELPLEITGIIGGVITLLIAFIIGFGGTEIVISPVFLSLIGLVLITGTFFRSFGGITLFKSLLNKETDQTD